MDSDVTTALRLGWELAEARGRSWPAKTQPVAADALPKAPEHLLPLRFQRDAHASRVESISTLVAQAARLHIANAEQLRDDLRASDKHISKSDWPALAKVFEDTDSYIQDQLAQHDDALANAYLLGRGLSESYWGLGARELWPDNEGASPSYLLGEKRRLELSRMLGRLGADTKRSGIHELTPAVIDGSLVAWGAVVDEKHDWVEASDLDTALYEQVRRWYQLLVLGQDPTTLVQPGARLRSRFYLVRTVRMFLPQIALAVLALALTTAAATHHLGPVNGLALLPSGLGALGLAGLMTRGQAMAQQALVRLRQDAYTDLVALSATIVPTDPHASDVFARLERLMPQRLLTPPTAAPASSAPAALARDMARSAEPG